MLSILQDIADQGTRVCLYYDNDQNCLLTILLGANEHGMWLDVGQLPPENKQLLLSGKITFVSMHQQIKIQFVARDIENDLFENNEALYLKLPDYLLRILRREFFRIAIPAAAPINCIIPIIPQSKKERIVMREVPILEISGDGIGLLCGEHEDTLLPEKIFRDCQISIPDIGILKVTIVVRNGFNFTTPDNVVHKRVGCSFILLDNKMNNLLQRYIIRLQGELQRAKALSQGGDEDDL
jgi:c-di-GMP-binding flagellar brake protein YcgR